MIPKGTPPNSRNWINCDCQQFKAAISSMRESGLVLISQRIGAHTIYTYNGTQVARAYENKGDGQHLISASLADHVKTGHKKNENKSIYEGGNL